MNQLGRDLTQTLLESGFLPLKSIEQYGQIMYRKEGEDINLVSIYDTDELLWEDSIHITNHILFELIGHGYKKVNNQYIFLTKDANELSILKNTSYEYWIIDKKKRQLIIYENQRQDYCAIYQSIESTLAKRSNKRDRRNIEYKKKMGMLIVVAINILVYVCMYIYREGCLKEVFIENGGISFQTVLRQKQYYRILTYMFLHDGLQHLVGNMIILFYLGGLLESKIGHFHFVMGYFLGGVIAAFCSLSYNGIYNPSFVSIGASGAIFAIVGMMVILVFYDRNLFKEIGMVNLLLFILLTVMNGLSVKGIDNAAHIGGLLFGLFYSYTRVLKK